MTAPLNAAARKQATGQHSAPRHRIEGGTAPAGRARENRQAARPRFTGYRNSIWIDAKGLPLGTTKGVQRRPLYFVVAGPRAGRATSLSWQCEISVGLGLRRCSQRAEAGAPSDGACSTPSRER